MPPIILILAAALFAVAVIAGGLSINTASIPQPLDEATRLETAQTKTATYAGTAFDLGKPASGAGIGQPMAAVVHATAVVGTGTYTAQLMDSPDGATWTAIGPVVTIAAAAPAWYSVPGFRTQEFVAVALTLGGTAPSITYDAWLTTQGFPRT